MAYHNATKTSGFRELKSDELESISGGLSFSIAMLEELVKPNTEIVVTGQRGGAGLNFWTDMLGFSADRGFWENVGDMIDNPATALGRALDGGGELYQMVAEDVRNGEGHFGYYAVGTYHIK